MTKPLWTRDFILAFISNFLMSFAFYLLMPTLPLHLTEHLKVSSAAAGAVMSAYVIAALVMRPFSGFLIDSFPRKKTYLISYVIFIALTAAYLGASTVGAFLVIRILHGLVWSPITTSGNTIAIDIVPSNRRGEGIAYFGMSTYLAMATGPLLGLLICEHYPFAWAFYAATVSGIAGFIVACRICAPIKAPISRSALSLDRFLLIKGIGPGVALVFIMTAWGVMNTYVGMYGKEHHISNAGFFFVALAAGIIFSRLLMGKLIDRGCDVHVGVAGALFAAGGVLLLGRFPNAACFFTSAFIIGCGYGMVFPSMQAVMIKLARHDQRGTANSTYFTACDLGIGGGMLLGGKIAAYSSISTAFLIGSGTTLIGGVLLAIFAKRRQSDLLHLN